MKISFITTIYNEEKTIDSFLNSLLFQSKIPDEIIIVDGGSTDDTVERIKKHDSRIKSKKLKLKVFVKKGNRSVGRNEAIKRATGDVIVCSDSGNMLDKDWVKNMIKPFKDPKVDVVAGYYRGKAENVFQKCIIPYALVMPDKVDPDNFLPATRSIAFTKAVWKKVNGFDESLSHNEDYVFARKLKEIGANFVFAKDAIVYWQPRNTFKQAFIMFIRFAYGDAEASIIRTSVLLLFARYFLGLYLVFLSFLYQSYIPLLIVFIGFLIYLFWAILKNYKYVQNKLAIVYLPLIQINADMAVILGTFFGILKLVKNLKRKK